LCDPDSEEKEAEKVCMDEYMGQGTLAERAGLMYDGIIVLYARHVWK